MKISLITVCYNAEKTIGDAMESVAKQRVDGGRCLVDGGKSEIEYIVVDGGSTDSTVDIIKKFAEQFHCSPSSSSLTFRWLSEKDNGMYDALNKGMKMATGDVIGLLNADDVLAEDDTLTKIAAAFADPTIDGTYGDIRFVKENDHCRPTPTTYTSVRNSRTVRYCSGKWFRPWMFRFGTQTAHPSTFFRKECFAKWGDYSLDYGMYGDFELLCRFIWKNRARMKYLPLCTTVMRMGGLSTAGWRSNLQINREDLRAIRAELLRRAFRPFRTSSDTIALLERLGRFLHGDRRLTVSARRETRVYISTLLVNCAGKAIEEREAPEPRMMEEATAWLERHYAKKISLRALVEHMGYGRTRFFELFRRKTGLSPNDYLIRLRIAKARELLSTGKLSVKTVAERTGFSDAGFFSRTYKRLTGHKPTDTERTS